MAVVGFYGKHCLSNFSDHAIIVDDQHYPTVEHYFQTMKFVAATAVADDVIDNAISNNSGNTINDNKDNTSIISNNEIAKYIHHAATPDEAQALAKRYKQYRRADWSDVKDQIMLLALQVKLETHTDIRELLLSTGQAQLVETSPVDDYWGIGANCQGLNRMGQLWMSLRASLLPPQ